VPFSAAHFFSLITCVGKCGNSVGPIFDMRLSLQNGPTTYNPKHTAIAEITADPVKQVSGSPPKLNNAVDTTANDSENECTALGAEPGAVDNTAADVLEKRHAVAGPSQMLLWIVLSLLHQKISTLFAKLNSIVLQLTQGSKVLLDEKCATLVTDKTS